MNSPDGQSVLAGLPWSSVESEPRRSGRTDLNPLVLDAAQVSSQVAGVHGLVKFVSGTGQISLFLVFSLVTYRLFLAKIKPCRFGQFPLAIVEGQKALRFEF